LAAILALVVLLANFDLEPRSAEEYGRGGPSEPPLKTVLGAENLPGMAQAASLGTLIRQNPGQCLPLAELGPVFRPDEGPVAMRIARGQTFYEALEARDVGHEDIMTLVKACKEFRNLRSVRSGELFTLHVTPDGGLQSLAFDLDEESYVTWVRDGDTYTRQDGTYPVEHRLKGVGGTISMSLYASLQELDAPLSLAAKMSDILGWDIDFTRDLRKGDTFRIMYEEVWKDEEFVRTGNIRSVELINRGQTRQAFLFTDREDRSHYYDAEGHNLQKQLLRAPVNYSRISSGFSYRRLHPVLNRWMPHLGVDYAAPLGTPVKAGGDGTVVACTSKKGNGRYIQIRHTNAEYETFYLHLSRYAKGIRKGSQVSQGQIIGYVGASGYATGPHLDYRVRRNGKFVNPRTLKLPASAPVSEDLRASFSSQTGIYLAVMDDIPLAAAPVTVPPMALLQAPAWDGPAMAILDIPETIRALD